jgi:sugar (pentulose or hexulose) kinase
MVEVYIVLDIGKTNVKLTALDDSARVQAELRRANVARDVPPYLQHDVEGIWSWLLQALTAWSRRYAIRAIVPVTHGATAALVDDDGLVLPVLDYEAQLEAGAGSAAAAYDSVRPPFAQTCSPSLPAGLNLGRQLHRLQQVYPARFAGARHILLYPQYWAWRLSGVAASEWTSLGCHTDLWQPYQRSYSSLVAAMDWQTLMPPLQAAGAVLGPLLPQLAALTGVGSACRIVCGIHDSNASLLRHLDGDRKTILSTGTWVIAAALNAELTVLDEQRDMLVNVSAAGMPVSCMRFMGGREFAQLAGADPQVCCEADLRHLIASGTLAVPCFAAIGGPYAGHAGRIIGRLPRTAGERYALATLYCALMTDHCLQQLDADAPVVVEGSFSANPYFAGLLAALRPGRQVTVSEDACGTTLGGWLLATGKPLPDQQAAAPVQPLRLPGLDDYTHQWRAACPAR